MSFEKDIMPPPAPKRRRRSFQEPDRKITVITHDNISIIGSAHARTEYKTDTFTLYSPANCFIVSSFQFPGHCFYSTTPFDDYKQVGELANTIICNSRNIKYDTIYIFVTVDGKRKVYVAGHDSASDEDLYVIHEFLVTHMGY